MMRSGMLATLTLLTSCMATPEQLLQSGSARVATLQGSPYEAAYCIERNAHNPSATGIASHRALADSIGVEVIVRRVGDPAGTIALAHLRPDAGGGTRAELWVSQRVDEEGGAITQKLYEGCAVR